MDKLHYDCASILGELCAALERLAALESILASNRDSGSLDGALHDLQAEMQSLRIAHTAEISRLRLQLDQAQRRAGSLIPQEQFEAEVARLQRLAEGMVPRTRYEAKADELDAARMENERLRRQMEGMVTLDKI